MTSTPPTLPSLRPAAAALVAATMQAPVHPGKFKPYTPATLRALHHSISLNERIGVHNV